MSQVMIQSLPIIAKALGRNMGVKVKVDAGRARTNGKVIYLPSLPLNDPGVETLGLGYIIHEAGHIRYSDFNIDYRDLTPLEAKFAGVMEDIRMERCVIRDYPGAPKRLAALVEKLVHSGFFQPISDFDPPVAVLVAYMLYKLRAHVLDQPALEGYATQAEARLTELVTDMTMTRIRSVMARVTSCQNESDVIELAREVAQILKEESERKSPPQDGNDQNPDQGDGSGQDQNQSQPDDNGDGQDDDSTSDQNPTQSNEDGDDGDDSDDSQSSGSTDSDADPDSDTDDASDGGAGNEDGEGTDDDFKAAKQAMKDILDSDESDIDQLPGDISDAFEDLLQSELKEASQRGNEPVNMNATSMSDSIQPGDHQAALDEAEAATAALRNRLIQLVQSQAKAKRKTSRHGRRLNDRKLHRIKSGNTRVYKKVSRKKAVNTTVQVLLDRSSSMRSGMSVASQSTLALTAAMKKIPHLSVGASFFPGLGRSAATVLTDHEQQMYQTAGYYPAVDAYGTTPLLEALMWSGDTLLERKEERKILIVITDGTPDGFGDCQEAISDLKRGGIEVYGLGIDVNLEMMTALFNGEMTVIEDVGELAQATFSLLENKLFAA